MGLQDYTTRLTPSSLESVSFQQVVGTLLDIGFEEGEPAVVVSGARLAVPPQNEFFFVRHDRVSVIEALLRRDTEAPQSVGSLSLRFALCQPSAATSVFLDVVAALALQYQFNIAGEHALYCPNCLDEFRQEVELRVAEGKARWRALFEGDATELPIGVDQAWSYFLERHPGLVSSR
jgi:hypothetical protein